MQLNIIKNNQEITVNLENSKDKLIFNLEKNEVSNEKILSFLTTLAENLQGCNPDDFKIKYDQDEKHEAYIHVYQLFSTFCKDFLAKMESYQKEVDKDLASK